MASRDSGPLWILKQVHGPSLQWAILWTSLLAFGIWAGSRGLERFDPALVGYTYACLFSFGCIVYRYSVWLTKPPTRLFWRRGWQLFLSPKAWLTLEAPKVLFPAIWSKLLFQDFVLRRGFKRWVGHMLLAWGCILAAMVTFPLVFGWLYFEQAVPGPDGSSYAVFMGFKVMQIPNTGVFAWCVYHVLVICSFMVIPGVIIATWRRLTDEGAMAVQRFERDFLPLFLLFAISVTGLLIWVSYEFLDGQYHGAMAQVHAYTVIITLLYLPFGKLFHIFQRPASLGVACYKAAYGRERAVCPVTSEEFAPKVQTQDLKQVLHELGFDYSSTDGKAPEWNEISPKGRRVLIGRAHNRVRGGRFS